MDKSPLQIAANKKFNCASVLKEMIPRGSVLNSFPFYDGNLEFQVMKDDRFLVAHTNKYSVYEFWRCAMADSARVLSLAREIWPLESPGMFHVYQDKQVKLKDPFVRSAVFYALNQTSDSGLISSGKQVRQDLDPLCELALKKFNSDRFHIKFDNETDEALTFSNTNDGEYSLIIGGRYSHNLFEEGKPAGPEETKLYHDKIKKHFESTAGRTVLVYHYSVGVMKAYRTYNIRMMNKWGRPTEDRESCAEVIIANF
jgi:hypothetical protein